VLKGNKFFFLLCLFVFLLVFINPAVDAEEIKVYINENVKTNEKADVNEDVDINEGEIEEIKERFQFKFGSVKGNWGPAITFMKTDFTELNQCLEAEGFKALTEDLILTGSGGIIGFKGGSRFGGYGLSGIVNSISNSGQKASYTFDYGGFLYEYGIYTGHDLDISLGSLFGGGTETIDLIYGKVDEFPGIPQRNIFTNDFFLLEPRLNFHYQFTSFMGLDVSAGYLYRYNKEGLWKIDDREINVPINEQSSYIYGLKLTFGF